MGYVTSNQYYIIGNYNIRLYYIYVYKWEKVNMLKIKENVDLGELEKFGFRALKNFVYKPKKGEWSVIEIKIDPLTRIIDISGISDLFHTKEDTLYDLIKADLVEKVDDYDDKK